MLLEGSVFQKLTELARFHYTNSSTQGLIQFLDLSISELETGEDQESGEEAKKETNYWLEAAMSQPCNKFLLKNCNVYLTKVYF